ncbi:MAG: Wzz/FepE/Etk N-terminal domain-containing protein [bacterium]|nr:Wzz/FepE/Etk N-terminal domain-containing protein [bacterium]
MKNRLSFKRDSERPKTRAHSINENVNLADLLQIIRSNFRLIAIVTLAIMIISAVVTLSTPDRFSSRASLLPSGQTDRMASIKLLAGLSSKSTNENSSELFPLILRSNSVRDSVLAANYSLTVEGSKTSYRLSDYLGSDNQDLLRERLSAITAIDTDTKTGLIEIAVETTAPELSQAVTTEYLVQLNRYNVQERQTEAGRTAEYLERELAEKRTELSRAEDSLSLFQSYNRNWRTSSDPGLLTELAALKRDVEIKAEVFAFLSRELESARLETQKDTPVIRVLDHPSLPTIKSGPRRILTIFMSGITAFLMLVMLFIGRSLLQRNRTASLSGVNRPTTGESGRPATKSLAEPVVD